eukprot:TRINITY_DN918_c0_g1_i12.p1 TRINITY_DN918_c0_g1~~TRINITY_DN918_c0_g1_i12.p1  ORF type:complete len:763 (-),score=170.46 TRINITY_DN918_c0_g1_i12:663-2618(-)
MERTHETDFGGEGWKPWLCDPGSVIAVTDGRDPSIFDSPLKNWLSFSDCESRWKSIQSRPWRWDQRLFVIFLSIPGTCKTDGTEDWVFTESRKRWGTLCLQSGGEMFTANSLNAALLVAQEISDLISSSMRSVVLKIRPDGRESGESLEEINSSWRMDVESNVSGVWAIPEDFFPPSSSTSTTSTAAASTSLRIRPSNPRIVHANPLDEHRPMYLIPDGIVGNTYPIAPSFRKGPHPFEGTGDIALFVRNSDGDGEHGSGHPFAFLRKSESGWSITILPYNFPLLFQIINRGRETSWKDITFHKSALWKYRKTIPPYYWNSVDSLLASIVPHECIPRDFPIYKAIRMHVDDWARKTFDHLINRKEKSHRRRNPPQKFLQSLFHRDRTESIDGSAPEEKQEKETAFQAGKRSQMMSLSSSPMMISLDQEIDQFRSILLGLPTSAAKPSQRRVNDGESFLRNPFADFVSRLHHFRVPSHMRKSVRIRVDEVEDDEKASSGKESIFAAGKSSFASYQEIFRERVRARIRGEAMSSMSSVHYSKTTLPVESESIMVSHETTIRHDSIARFVESIEDQFLEQRDQIQLLSRNSSHDLRKCIHLARHARRKHDIDAFITLFRSVTRTLQTPHRFRRNLKRIATRANNPHVLSVVDTL